MLGETAMALQTAMQGRARQMGYRRLQRVQAITQRQQCVAPEGNDDRLFLDRQNR